MDNCRVVCGGVALWENNLLQIRPEFKILFAAGLYLFFLLDFTSDQSSDCVSIHMDNGKEVTKLFGYLRPTKGTVIIFCRPKSKG